jgi:MoxR-like ATPase
MSVAEKLKVKDTNRELLQRFEDKAHEVILDKDLQIRLFLCTVLAGGHMLIEDMPGMGKTTMVKMFGQLLGLDFRRIQFTNDLLPADIIGSVIFDEKSQKFNFHKGPIFGELVLADEVNRATPKTQSACLQAMEEYQVSVDGKGYSLPHPFFLIATQNPKQNIGTFPLPESQLDRFLMKISLGFPNREAERQLLMGESRHKIIEHIDRVMSPSDVIAMQDLVKRVRISAKVVDYLQNIVDLSRSKYQGLSPRAALGMIRAAQAWAYIEGREFVVPEDIQAIGVPTMNHRLATSDDPFGMNGVRRAQEILESVPV